MKFIGGPSTVGFGRTISRSTGSSMIQAYSTYATHRHTEPVYTFLGLEIRNLSTLSSRPDNKDQRSRLVGTNKHYSPGTYSSRPVKSMNCLMVGYSLKFIGRPRSASAVSQISSCKRRTRVRVPSFSYRTFVFTSTATAQRDSRTKI